MSWGFPKHQTINQVFSSQWKEARKEGSEGGRKEKGGRERGLQVQKFNLDGA